MKQKNIGLCFFCIILGSIVESISSLRFLVDIYVAIILMSHARYRLEISGERRFVEKNNKKTKKDVI